MKKLEEIDKSVWLKWKQFEIDEQQPGFFQDLMTAFTQSVPQDFKNLESSLQNGDHKRATYYAHTLKSSFRYLGILEIGDALEQIEHAGRQNLVLPIELFHQVQEALPAIFQQLQSEVQNISLVS